jgi:hypothetical protein
MVDETLQEHFREIYISSVIQIPNLGTKCLHHITIEELHERKSCGSGLENRYF